jgi:ParB-like chromosome segregation protein Spo0J
MDKPKWTERTVALSELKPNPRNPRTITEEQFRKLKKSLNDTGYHGRILVDPALNILGGHMRLLALRELGWKEVPVLVSDRDLTEDEKKRITIQDNLSFGEWDYDILSAEHDPEDLTYWGFPERLLDQAKGDIEEAEEPEEKEKESKVCPHCGKEI